MAPKSRRYLVPFALRAGYPGVPGSAATSIHLQVVNANGLSALNVRALCTKALLGSGNSFASSGIRPCRRPRSQALQEKLLLEGGGGGSSKAAAPGRQRAILAAAEQAALAAVEAQRQITQAVIEGSGDLAGID
eukprot:1180466-Prorocentrum_minimum.AAC.1